MEVLAMSCEESAWLVIRFTAQFTAIALWLASTFGLSVFALYCFGCFRWNKK